MPHLLKEWPNVSQRLREASRVLLLFDYDGTLTPIVSRPELATLSPEVRQLLENLSVKRRYLVGVISGRSLDDVRGKVKVPGITYAGNHGLEIAGPGVNFLHPGASELRPVLSRICRDLTQRLGQYQGVIVENKGLTLSVHSRMTPDQLVRQVESAFDSTVAPFQASGQVRVTYGKKVSEVRPNVEWHKGRAIAKLLELYPEVSLAVFFGDDVTDEDGFTAVQDVDGIAVFVGPADHTTRANYRVDSPEQVAEALQLMAQL